MLEIETWNALGAKKVDFGNKIYKTTNAICNSCQKVGHFISKCRSKNKINFVDKKKPEGIYCINLSASESGSEFANNVTPKTEVKSLSKNNWEINSVDINFLISSGARVNIINIEALEKISKDCEIGLETTNSETYIRLVHITHWI